MYSHIFNVASFFCEPSVERERERPAMTKGMEMHLLLNENTIISHDNSGVWSLERNSLASRTE